MRDQTHDGIVEEIREFDHDSVKFIINQFTSRIVILNAICTGKDIHAHEIIIMITSDFNEPQVIMRKFHGVKFNPLLRIVSDEQLVGADGSKPIPHITGEGIRNNHVIDIDIQRNCDLATFIGIDNLHTVIVLILEDLYLQRNEFRIIIFLFLFFIFRSILRQEVNHFFDSICSDLIGVILSCFFSYFLLDYFNRSNLSYLFLRFLYLNFFFLYYRDLLSFRKNSISRITAPIIVNHVGDDIPTSLIDGEHILLQRSLQHIQPIPIDSMNGSVGESLPIDVHGGNIVITFILTDISPLPILI